MDFDNGHEAKGGTAKTEQPNQAGFNSLLYITTKFLVNKQYHQAILNWNMYSANLLDPSFWYPGMLQYCGINGNLDREIGD